MLKANFDGSKKGGKDGVASYGYVIYRGGKVIHEDSGIVGVGEDYTNNIAEYYALLMLSNCIPNYVKKKEGVVIRGDSRLVINQVSGKWRINEDRFYYYIDKIRENLRRLSVVYVWIPREENEVADRLAMEAYNAYLTEEMKKSV